MAYAIGIKFFNSFWMKKVVPKAGTDMNPTGSPATVNLAWPKPGDELPLSLWPGVPWNPTGYPIFPWNEAVVNANENQSRGQERQWYIEESVIRGGFNNTRVDLGVRAYLVEDDEAVQQRRGNSLIYSGVYNSRTGINDTNVFSIGEDITKSVNPSYGSIQKLFAENTNLNIFQENKVQYALINKDAVYSAEGSPMQTQSNVVIGQIVPYLGEYGISRNPESFATYGFQKYFADANRGIIGRLSRDGITEISNYGMKDYFREALSGINPDSSVVTLSFPVALPALLPNNINYMNITADPCGCGDIETGMTLFIPGVNGEGDFTWFDTGAWVVETIDNGSYCTLIFSSYLNWDDYNLLAWPSEIRLQRYISDRIIGGWDIHNQCYTVSLQPTRVENDCVNEDNYETLNFDESINGWVSFHGYKPRMMCSLKSSFFSSDSFKLWKHYYDTPTSRGFFYDQPYQSAQITFVFNPSVSTMKSFQTVGYEGSNGWEVISYESDPTEFDQYPGPINPPTAFPGTYSLSWQFYIDEAQRIYSYEQGRYVDPTDGLIYRVGFDRKENRYVSELKSASLTQAGEVISWDGNPNTAAPISGIKGYFVTVNLQTDDVTDVGGLKELFAVSSNWVVSSH